MGAIMLTVMLLVEDETLVLGVIMVETEGPLVGTMGRI
ncbi:Uncharacterised protein [Edwardsiella hoshinae]|uniref:Uncharacterized protein n=1 Tax=Edwardsiella hoshinae TaxID=93378 RepID=A0A376J0T4_9GAMM|nr:Uncharacterised protein [Edwardsiella hoshinae]